MQEADIKEHSLEILEQKISGNQEKIEYNNIETMKIFIGT